MSRLAVIEKPPRVLSLADAKAHLRVDDAGEDALIGALIDAAQGHIDGPHGWLGRCIGRQTIEMSIDRLRFRTEFRLPLPPIVGVTAVTFEDDDGEETVDPSKYSLDGDRLRFLAGGAPWSGRCDRPSPRIRYVAGYEPDDVPAPILAAIKLMVGDLYRHRDTVALGQANAVPMSTTVDALLSPYRVWAV